MKVNGLLQTPRRFNSGDTVTTTHWIGGCVGTEADTHAFEERFVKVILKKLFLEKNFIKWYVLKIIYKSTFIKK
jgi:hypothetical protein